ncbi:LysM peptidoglycan-binding domain-containing protein [Lysinibacillus sp. NPDC098008]|uniref:LysM peptidoglycan-binding domain-containing protein n=1 Tax=Lysinibacillus sp. NPDC098008 TaxID=3364146 RepID=UPI0038109F47
MRIHIVQKGDTLWKIAKEYGISFEDLKRLNVHLANPDYIVPGMEIILPEKINKESQRHSPKEMPKKETQVPKEAPITKEAPKKEVQKPTPPPPPIVPPPPAPMPMPEPRMIPIPIPMPMQMPQQPMWVPQPVEMNWHQQVVMPQVEQNVTPPVQIQPPPKPAPVPPPVAKPKPEPPPPKPQPQPAPPPPVQMMPQMPAVPYCPSCHQPVYHQMWWQMPMQPQVEPYMMPQQPMPCDMPKQKIGGIDDFLESTPFFPKHDTQMQPQFDMNMGQSCGCGTQPQPMMMPDMNMGQSCGCGTQPQPMMMPTWYMDPCHCPPPPCPSGGPWMPPHYFPGGMTPYRW